jgi:hypothetical protein
MVASVGATVGTSVVCPSSWMIESAQSSPNTAVTIGSAIAVAVPNANRRMIIAAASPIASLVSVFAFDTCCPT